MFVRYRVRFEQSWRIGSGEGAGASVDALVRRDGLDLPFVPGTTMRGLVAGAIRELARPLGLTLCEGTVRRESPEEGPAALCGVTRPGLCPLCLLTGSPHREGLTRWGPARLALEADGCDLAAIARSAVAAEAARTPGLLARPRPRTSIDRRSGRAADDLRVTHEDARWRLELHGRVDLDPALPPDEVALLVAALRWIRELGGGRRRGLGGCRLELVEADLAPAFGGWQEALRHLAPATGDGPAPGTAVEAAGSGPAQTSARGSSRARNASAGRTAGATAIRLEAVVLGEVSLGGRPESGNQVAALPFVPGSTVRGGFAALWQGPREGEDFARCFLSGRVRFGYLYPVTDHGTALPSPFSLHTCKLTPGPRQLLGHGVIDLLYQPDAERCRESGCGGRLVPWQGWLERDLPGLALSPHNRIDPVAQTVSRGGLFAYEVLPEGTRLRGFLRAASEEELDRLLAGLGLVPGDRFELRAGRRKGSLGRLDCRLAPLDGNDGGVGLFPDAEPVPESCGEGMALRVDLLTPAILRDPHLRFRSRLSPADLGIDRADFDSSFAATTVIAGWNTAHRLPKSDHLAVVAGSSYLLERISGDELTSLRRSALDGVGERREEGFGAFRLRAVAPAERG